MTLIYLMRHGETAWNGARRLQGQADIPLSEAGRADVSAQRGLFLPQRGVAVASDLRRTVETAALMGFAGIQTDPGLREIDLGDWEGRGIDDLIQEDRAAYLGWRYGRHTPPGGEPWPAFCDRVMAALHRHAARAEAEGTDLLVFGHGGGIRAVLDRLLEIPLERLDPLAPASTCVIRLASPATLLSYNLRRR